MDGEAQLPRSQCQGRNALVKGSAGSGESSYLPCYRPSARQQRVLLPSRKWLTGDCTFVCVCTLVVVTYFCVLINEVVRENARVRTHERL